MTTLLNITSSLFGAQGQSSQLAERFIATWRSRHPDGRVINRELAAEAIPHLTAERFQAFLSPVAGRSLAQQAILRFSDNLIEEWRQADTVVLGLPMYNFGIPSTLKAYFDHLARSGVTFKYTAQGPVGLLADRPVHIFAARGGQYADTPLDTQTPYLRQFLGFLGIRDMRFVYAEGLNMGEPARTAALQAAHEHIQSQAA